MIKKVAVMIRDKYRVIISEYEAKRAREVLERFIDSYEAHKDSMDNRTWLIYQLQNELPERSQDDITTMADEIISSIEIFEESKAKLQAANDNGQSTHSWLSHQIEQSALRVGNQDLKDSENFRHSEALPKNLDSSHAFRMTGNQDRDSSTTSQNDDRGRGINPDSQKNVEFLDSKKHIKDSSLIAQNDEALQAQSDKVHHIKQSNVANNNTSDVILNYPISHVGYPLGHVERSETSNTSKNDNQKLTDMLQSSLESQSSHGVTNYLNIIDSTLKECNENMAKTILNQNGSVNMNPNLDGFIAEQHHANTYNIDAATKGSEYRAQTLQNTNANSVDIVIKDSNGNIKHKYQSKYGKDANSTENLFDKGDYKGQQKIVPSEQIQELNDKGIKAQERIKTDDGVQSKPLSKEEAKQMQEKAQKNGKITYDYKDVSIKNLSKQIGWEALGGGLISAGISGGFELARQFYSNEKFNDKKVAKEALKSGLDTSVKIAAAGALKVCAERGIISILRGTSANVCTAIAFSAIENAKILYQMTTGQKGLIEGLDCMGNTSASVASGLLASFEGVAIGASIGTALGPIGSAIGGFIGGTIGYMGGSAIGSAIYEGTKVVAKGVYNTVKSAVSTVGSALSSIGSAVCNAASSVASGMKSAFDSACDFVGGLFS